MVGDGGWFLSPVIAMVAYCWYWQCWYEVLLVAVAPVVVVQVVLVLDLVLVCRRWFVLVISTTQETGESRFDPSSVHAVADARAHTH